MSKVSTKILQVFRLFNQANFLINFFSSNISSLLIKIFNLILFLFLVRNFSLSEYGIYIFVWAQISILSPFLDFGTSSYGLLHLKELEKKQVDSFISFRFFLSLLVFIFTLLFTITLKQNMSTLFYIFLTSFVIFSNMWSGTYLVITSVRNKTYLSSITSTIFNLLLAFTTIVFIIYYHQFSVIFLLIFIFYNFYSFLNCLLVFKELDSIHIAFDYKRWIEIIKKSYIFVLISFFGGLYFKIDVILLQLMKSSYDVGVYSSGYKIFEALILFASSYSLTATPILAAYYRDNHAKLLNKIKMDIILLSILGILVSITTYIVGPYILSIILKSNAAESSTVLKIVIFSLPLLLINTILLNLLYVFNKAYIVVLLFFFQTIFNLVLNLLLIPQYSYIGSAYITVISELINVLITSIIVYKLIKKLKSD